MANENRDNTALLVIVAIIGIYLLYTKKMLPGQSTDNGVTVDDSGYHINDSKPGTITNVTSKKMAGLPHSV